MGLQFNFCQKYGVIPSFYEIYEVMLSFAKIKILFILSNLWNYVQFCFNCGVLPLIFTFCIYLCKYLKFGICKYLSFDIFEIWHM
jgi:hypothetical protein